jgi:hypothetical protein
MKLDTDLVIRFLKSKKTQASVGIFVDRLVDIARTEFVSTQTDPSNLLQLDLLRNICNLVEIACIDKKYTVDHKINKKNVAIQIYLTLLPAAKNNQDVINKLESYIEDLHNNNDIRTPHCLKVAFYRLWRYLSKKT